MHAASSAQSSATTACLSSQTATPKASAKSRSTSTRCVLLRSNFGASREHAADYLNRKLKEVRDTGKVVGNERIAIMAALNIAHEFMSKPAGTPASFDATAIRRRITAMQETLEAALAADQEKLF